MSEQYGMPVEQIKSIVSVENIKADLATRKALDLIKASVK